MKPVTAWYRLTDNGLEFNHIEDGHKDQMPTPKHPNHESWSRSYWAHFHVHLDDRNVITE